MRYPSSLALVALFAVPAAAQDLLYYKFDSKCTNEAINYASGALALPAGRIETNSAVAGFNSRTSGMFGGGLTGGLNVSGYYNRVMTGWMNPNVPSGDFTYAFFMKEANAPGTSISYFWAGTGSFRMFTNGIAGKGLYQRVIVSAGGNGINSTVTNDIYLATDVQTPAAAGWVHIALVIDSTAQTATWYINGAPDTVINGVPGALINATGEVRIGTHTGSTGATWNYDLDEVIVSTRAYSAAEIKALANDPRAADGPYMSEITAQCGKTALSSVGGPPTVGNANYGLQIDHNGAGLYQVVVGSNRCSFAGGAFTLPLDMGTLAPIAAGCWLLSDADVTSLGGATPGGSWTQPAPVPNVPALHGLTLFSQVLLIDLATLSVEASNGWSIAIAN